MLEEAFDKRLPPTIRCQTVSTDTQRGSELQLWRQPRDSGKGHQVKSLKSARVRFAKCTRSATSLVGKRLQNAHKHKQRSIRSRIEGKGDASCACTFWRHTSAGATFAIFAGTPFWDHIHLR